MSDEAPHTADAAIRAFIGAVAFTVVLCGGELMVANRFWTGLFIGILGLPLYLSTVFWKALKPKLNLRFLVTLNGIATDARWWFGALGVVIVFAAFSPFIEQWRLPYTAPKFVLFTSEAPDVRIAHPFGISLQDALAHDFPGTQQVTSDFKIQTDGGLLVPMRVIAFRDQHDGAAFLGAYISRSSFTEQLLKQVLDQHQALLNKLHNGSISIEGFGQTGTESTDMTRFTGMVVVYYENDLSLEQQANLAKYANSLGLNLILRNKTYLLFHGSPPPKQ
jgi:hypothetical protein